jgi:hypothetical protein
MVDKLSGNDRLGYARDIITVVRTLEVLDTTMQQGDLADVIHLQVTEGDDHRPRLIMLMNDAADIERITFDKASNYARFVNKKGEPGPGAFKPSRRVVV